MNRCKKVLNQRKQFLPNRKGEENKKKKFAEVFDRIKFEIPSGVLSQ